MSCDAGWWLEARFEATGQKDPKIKSAYDMLHEMDSAAKTH